jgi:hypothetical protein
MQLKGLQILIRRHVLSVNNAPILKFSNERMLHQPIGDVPHRVGADLTHAKIIVSINFANRRISRKSGSIG